MWEVKKRVVMTAANTTIIRRRNLLAEGMLESGRKIDRALCLDLGITHTIREGSARK